jgi:protein SCO1/2
MQRVVFGIGIGVFLVAIVLLSWQWLGIGRQSFEAEGRVTGVADGGETLYIEHEKIEGFREAMSSPFQIESPSISDSLKRGDALRFQFTAGTGQARITGIEELPDNALPQNPAAKEMENAEGAPSASLDVGEQVPDVTLVDQEGEEIRLSDFRGKALVLTFIYTECPLPDFCPLMSKQFAALQPKLKDAFGEEVHLLSISFDPKTDTPPVLTEYGQKYTDDFSTWTFATPTSQGELERAKEAFSITTTEKKGEIVHNLVTALVGPDGRLVWTWRGNDWTPEDILEVAKQAQ